MDYGLIGEKLTHSFSKEIHEQIGGYTYVLREVQRESLDAFMKEHAFCGINVTIPYKQQVIPYLDHIDESAGQIGTVNTIVNRDGKLYGFNTDYTGLKKLIAQRFDLNGRKVLILGSGGTSKTARTVCRDLGAASVLRVSRSAAEEDTILYTDLNAHTDTDYLINTTPLGMYPNPDASPADLTMFDHLSGVVDVIYNPLRTRLLLQAESLKIPCTGGLPMLVYQAVAAASHFTGREVENERAEEICRSILTQRENLVLIGMPGSGKSTIGRMLSKKLQMDFTDTDDEIVQKTGRAITDIFAKDGEAAFRKMEEELALTLQTCQHTVISTGGGFILNPVCEMAMKAYGRVIFLDREPDRIKPTDDRPLADEREKIEKLYRQRLPAYRRIADHTIPVTGTPEDVCEKLLQTIGQA
ncbi:MAG: shikimate dehydrogenase [Lachnospiraceae bacterium]|nr:shikimate dehydrogenase [Lachnospiraceae bacterium]